MNKFNQFEQRFNNEILNNKIILNNDYLNREGKATLRYLKEVFNINYAEIEEVRIYQISKTFYQCSLVVKGSEIIKSQILEINENNFNELKKYSIYNRFDEIKNRYNLNARNAQEFFYTLTCNPSYVGTLAKEDQNKAAGKDGIEIIKNIVECTDRDIVDISASIKYIKKSNKKYGKFEGFGLTLDNAQIILEIFGECEETKEEQDIVKKWEKRNAKTLKQVLSESIGGGNFQIYQCGSSSEYVIIGTNKQAFFTCNNNIYELLDKKPDHNKKAQAVANTIRSEM